MFYLNIKEAISLHRNKILISIIVLLVLIVLAFLYLVSTPITCDSFSCFQEQMRQCSQAVHINEDSQASWLYEVHGRTGGECEVSVVLLQAREGELGLRRLEGKDMTCFYPSGTSAYPEKDLDKCHGVLKEELQLIMIEKMHQHVLDNLDSIREGLRS